MELICSNGKSDSDTKFTNHLPHHSVSDSDLQMKEGGGGGVMQTLSYGGGRSPKKFFKPFRPHFGLKIRGEAGPLRPFPGSATAMN